MPLALLTQETSQAPRAEEHLGTSDSTARETGMRRDGLRMCLSGDEERFRILHRIAGADGVCSPAADRLKFWA